MDRKDLSLPVFSHGKTEETEGSPPPNIKIVNFNNDSKTRTFIVVRAILASFSFRKLFFLSLFAEKNEAISRIINIVRVILELTVPGEKNIESFMELNHKFFGLAGQEYSHRIRI